MSRTRFVLNSRAWERKITEALYDHAAFENSYVECTHKFEDQLRFEISNIVGNIESTATYALQQHLGPLASISTSSLPKLVRVTVRSPNAGVLGELDRHKHRLLGWLTTRTWSLAACATAFTLELAALALAGWRLSLHWSGHDRAWQTLVDRAGSLNLADAVQTNFL